ncbi:MAG: hypothetical protein R3F43_13890 [bacterium]
MAAAVAFVALRPGDAPGDGPGLTEPGVRAKGTAVLRVMRQRGDAPAAEILSGAPCRPGDRLRFVVDLSAPGQVQIVSRGADGALAAVWPAAGAQAMPAGRDQLVPGAVALDDAPGEERLYLVHCTDAAPACTASGEGFTCPAGCTTSLFVVGREPAP